MDIVGVVIEDYRQYDGEKLIALTAATDSAMVKSVNCYHLVLSRQKNQIYFSNQSSLPYVVWCKTIWVGSVDQQSHDHPPPWIFFAPNKVYLAGKTTYLLTAFVNIIDQKKAAWTRSLQASFMYKTCLSFSKTSPEIFGLAWTTRGNLF